MVPYAKIGLIHFPLFFFPSLVILSNPFPIRQWSVGQTTDILWLPPIYTIFILSFKQVISAHYVTLLP